MCAKPFHTPACRELQLCPRNEWGFSPHRLMVRANDVDNTIYLCEYASTCPGHIPDADSVCRFKMLDKWYIAVLPD